MVLGTELSSFDIAVLSTTDAPWSRLGRTEKERISLEIGRKILETEPRERLYFELDSKGNLLSALTGRAIPFEEAFTTRTRVRSLVYIGGRDALWRNTGKQIDGREFLAQSLLSLNSVKNIALMYDVDRGVAFSGTAQNGFLKMTSGQIRGSIRHLVLLGMVVKDLSQISLRVFLGDYLTLIDYLCDDEMLRLPEREQSIGYGFASDDRGDQASPEFLSYIRQLAPLFTRLEDELSDIPSECSLLMSKFTAIIEWEMSLRQLFSGLLDLAEICPLDRFPSYVIPRDFGKLLKTLNSLERPIRLPARLAMDIAMFTEWFLYTYAGVLNLHLLALARALLKQPVLALQYAVNAVNTSLWLAWASGMITTLLMSPSTELNDLLGTGWSMQFGGNGLNFRIQGGIDQALPLLADEHLRDALSKLENGVAKRLREKRNRSPLSHGFVADLTQKELRDCLPELQDLMMVLRHTIRVTLDRVVESLQASIQQFQNLPEPRDGEEELRGEMERLRMGGRLLEAIWPNAYFTSIEKLVNETLAQLDWTLSLARDYVVCEIFVDRRSSRSISFEAEDDDGACS